MADLTRDPAAGDAAAPRRTARREGNGHGAAPAGTRPVAPAPGDGDGRAPAPVDPRAVRVAPVPAEPGDPVLVVGPPPAAAEGPAAVPAPGSPDTAHAGPLVDGEGRAATLSPRGRGRARLVDPRIAPGGADLVLEAPRPGPHGSILREVLVDGFRFEIAVEPARLAALRERAARGRAAHAASGPLEIRAVIPGRVVAVAVAAGDAVTAGQQLLVVEAMKMQNELRSPRDGTITRVVVAPGATIEVGDLLAVIG